jgi:tetratricopeptide (TPR) repeat protein
MRIPAAVLATAVLALAASLSGCATGSQASAQAGEGAKVGAVGGVVAGAVGALLWGGNPLEGAVKGGITGAAAGAAMGAASGAQADAQQQQAAAAEAAKREREARLAELRQKMGESTWDAAVLLAKCKHADAMKKAEKAYAKEADPAKRSWALLVEAVAAEESGDRDAAAALYPRIVAEDPARGTPDQVRGEVLEGVMKMQRLRQEGGMPALCPAS